MTTAFINYLENKLLLSDLSPDSYEAISDCLHAVKLGEKALETHISMWNIGSGWAGELTSEEDMDYVLELSEIAQKWKELKDV